MAVGISLDVDLSVLIAIETLKETGELDPFAPCELLIIVVVKQIVRTESRRPPRR